MIKNNRVKYSPLRKLMMIGAIANQAKKKKKKEKADLETGQPAEADRETGQPAEDHL